MQTTTSATTTTANPMAPARCVFSNPDGSYTTEAIMAPARAPALLALVAADTNKRAVRQSDRFLYGCGNEQPSALDVSTRLLHLADLLSSLAHVLRAARWQDKPAPRLHEHLLPTGDSSDVWSHDVISELVWIQHAAEKLSAEGREQTQAEVMNVICTAYRYPNISPRTEAQLATKGHTTAEHLTLLACTVAGHIAQALQQVQGPTYTRLRTDGKQACALLKEAQTVIDAGVRYTLQIDDF